MGVESLSHSRESAGASLAEHRSHGRVPKRFMRLTIRLMPPELSELGLEGIAFGSKPRDLVVELVCRRIDGDDRLRLLVSWTYVEIGFVFCHAAGTD